jgi:hypothetical protein
MTEQIKDVERKVEDFDILSEDFAWLNKTYATDKNNLEFVSKGSDLNEVHEVSVKVVNDLTIEQMRYLIQNTIKRQVQDQLRDLLKESRDRLYEVYPKGSETTFNASALQPQKKVKDPEVEAQKAVDKLSAEARNKLLEKLLAEKAANEA